MHLCHTNLQIRLLAKVLIFRFIWSSTANTIHVYFPAGYHLNHQLLMNNLPYHNQYQVNVYKDILLSEKVNVG